MTLKWDIAMDFENRLKKFFDTLQSKKRLLIIGHQKPDGDALGSTGGFYTWLKREGYDATLFCKDLPAQQYKYLDAFFEYTNDSKIFEDAYDMVIVFDSGDLNYTGIDELIKKLPNSPILVNIDHHKTNQFYGDINIVDTESTSTCEIVTRIFEVNKVLIDPKMATSLMTGILTDTSHFSNAATTSRGMEIAGRLVGYGARMSEITKFLLKNKQLPILKIWGLALSRLQKNEAQDLAVTFVTNADFEKYAVPTNAVEGISNFLQGVTGNAESILVLHDRGNGTIKGSFRSVTRDVSAIAKLFGGGGHKLAAGFAVSGRIEETASGFEVV
jgi:bifunctional oligoribonuclease and PAP phosphatase NrnA